MTQDTLGSSRDGDMPIPVQPEPRPGMVLNNAGGYVYAASGWNRLRRFLVTGSEQGTYYVSERELTLENAQNVLDLLKQHPIRVIDEAVAVSQSGLAKSNDTALFVIALALTYGDDKTKAYASSKVTQVARTGTHILHLVAMIDSLRSWGRSVRRAIGNWYSQPADKLAYQMTKYQNRGGWSHRDVLRTIHIKPPSEEHSRLFQWALGRYEPEDDTGAMRIIYGMKLAHGVSDVHELSQVIREYGLEREHVPTQFLHEPKTWQALLPHLKYEALIRNLGNMSRSGLLVPDNPDTVDYVCSYITDNSNIRNSRIHPMKVLSAWYTYRRGIGIRSDSRWAPVVEVVEALEEAFYSSFHNVQPVGKELLVAVDCSGSMTYYSPVTGMNCFEAAVALAYITVRTERDVRIVLFSDNLIPVDEDWGSMSLEQAIASARSLIDAKGTDCSLPYLYAINSGLYVDGIVLYTDAESWNHGEHQADALNRYREQINPECRNATCAMVANHVQLADPDDELSLDIAGFSADTPQVVSAFLRGEF